MSTVKRVKIELDKTRFLVYDFKALKKFEDITGKSSLMFWETPMIRDVSTFLFVGLLSDDPELTQDQVDEMVDLGDVMTIMQALQDGWLANAANTEENGEDPNLSRPTG